MTVARIVPLQPPYSAPVAEALERIMPRGVAPLALFRTLAVNERVFLRTLAGGLLGKGTISLREREIVIARTCARCGCEYEWGVHAALFGAQAGLSEAEVAATCATDPRATPFSPCEQLLLRMVDELHDTADLGDALWQALRVHWEVEQLIELVALVGNYHLVSFVANALRVPRESFAARFPRSNHATP